MNTRVSPAIDWLWEAQDQRPDAETGAEIVHLTNSHSVSYMLDGEAPVASPDGRRVLILRCRDVNLDDDKALLVSDLATKRLALVDRVGKGALFNSGWGPWFAYLDRAGHVRRVDWETLHPETLLERDALDTLPGMPRDLWGRPAKPWKGGALSANGRHLFYVAMLLGPCPALLRLDLEQGRVDELHRQPDMINPHLQTEPVAGRWAMVQINTGAQLAPDGTVRTWGDGPTQLLAVPVEGGPPVRVYGDPGDPHCTGHECFVPGAGEVLMTVDWPSEHPQAANPPGNLMLAPVDGSRPRVLPTAPFHCFHVGTSRCGRYFVGDEVYDWPRKVPALVVGSLRTGRARYLLRDCGAYACGGHVTTQPRPFFSADNRHVLFSRSPFGLAQAAAVRIPDGFLEALDA